MTDDVVVRRGPGRPPKQQGGVVPQNDDQEAVLSPATSRPAPPLRKLSPLEQAQQEAEDRQRRLNEERAGTAKAPAPESSAPMPEELKDKPLIGRKVHRAQFHQGVNIGLGPNKTVTNGLAVNHVKPTHKAAMYVTPVGLVCYFADGREKLIPYSNVTEADLCTE